MKKLLIVLLLILHSFSQTDAINDFGVKDITVKSVKSLDPAIHKFNKKVDSLNLLKVTWIKNALLVALKFSETENMQGMNKNINIKSENENFNSVVIIIEDLGFLDDSVHGVRYKIWMVRNKRSPNLNKTGTSLRDAEEYEEITDSDPWYIKKALTATLCSRPEKYYTTGYCN